MTERTDHQAVLKRALIELREVRARLAEAERLRSEPIAVIGIGCRFPGGGHGPEAFWRMLCDGVDAVTEIPPDRWDVDAYFDPDPDRVGTTYGRWGAFLEGVDRFDPQFFGISMREAESLDPQQRLLLEVAWEALEHAGQPPDALEGSRTGLFAGIMTQDYYGLLQGPADFDGLNAYTATGSGFAVAVGRVSYTLGLRGPCVAVDTACSASLVAIHLACQSLRSGECALALAGGVNLIFSPHLHISFAKTRALAPDGRCKTFDASANGYVRGEGCGVVVLKRLSDAIAAGDEILAVVRGSAINHDGRTSGLTVPSGAAQEAVVREALSRAGVAPAEVDYVEAHGTGTPLGDPIEARALWSVLGEGRPADRRVLVGSVKTNLGHLEPAAGVAGFIKAVLALRHGEIPPHLHFRKPSQHIPWSEMSLAVPTERTPWPDRGGRRVAGVSSFGLGGTNAHVVLEAAPEGAARDGEPPVAEGRPEILLLSAHTAQALQAMAASHEAQLAAGPAAGAPALRDICFTASVSRAHLDHRAALIGCSRQEMAAGLGAIARGDPWPSATVAAGVGREQRRIVFVFPGQGAQWHGMGVGLLKQEPEFRRSMEACDGVVRELVGWSVLEELSAPEARSRLDEIDVLQPILFSLQVSLAALWRAWGIEPDAVVGHSLGEVAACCVAGGLSLEDAARVICQRSRIFREHMAGRGCIAVTELDFDEARRAIRDHEDRVAVAAVNGPSTTLLSGDTAAIGEIVAALEARNIFCRVLRATVASHSPMVDPLRGHVLRALEGLRPREASLRMYSTVTCAPLAGPELDAAYWVRNMREPVLFSRTLERLAEEGHDLILELSPHPTLLQAAERVLRACGRPGAALPSMRRHECERAGMLQSFGALFALGHPVNARRLFPPGCRRAPLPSYPWQRERCWFDPRPTRGRGPRSDHPAGTHPLLGPRVELALQPGTHVWQTEVGAGAPSFLGDHRIQGVALMPGAAYLDMALAAAEQALGPAPRALVDVRIARALFLAERGARPLQLVLSAGEAGVASVRILSLERAAASDGHGWVEHAAATLICDEDGAAPAEALDAIRGRCQEKIDAAAYYDALERRGIQYGPSFRGVEEIWRRDGEALGRVRAPAGPLGDAGAYFAHPALLDACFQLVAAALPAVEAQASATTAYLPVGLGRARLHGRLPLGTALWAHATVRTPAESAGDYLADVRILSDEGEPLVEALALRLTPLAPESAPRVPVDVGEWIYACAWPASPRRPATPTVGGAWLLLAGEGGLGAELAALLEARGEACCLVTPGPSYEVTGPGRYRLDPTRGEHLARLLGEALTGGLAWRVVIHLLGLDASRPGLTLGTAREAMERAQLGALHLVQAIAQTHAKSPPRLALVTRGLQPAGAAPFVPAPFQAPLWGLGGAILHEHPELRLLRVDLDPAGGSGDAPALLEEILHETEEDQLALRPGARHVARLVRRTGSTSPPQRLRLRRDATYLVTGGLTGIGLATACWMSERGARHLLLVGRRPATGEAKAAMEQMRADGTEVIAASADVADAEQLARVLAGIDSSMPPLRGVVHAAGVLDDGILLQLTADRLRAVLRPKVDGAWNLHTLTAGKPLDHFVLFSTLAAILGSPGQGNYAAANAFLDALAQHRRALGLPALSVNWGVWSEVGQAARPDRGGRLALRGLAGMAPPRALEALERVLGDGAVQAVVTPLDAGVLRRFYRIGAPWPLLDQLAPDVSPAPATAGDGLTREDLLSTPAADQRKRVEDYLLAQAAGLLKMPASRLDPRQPLARWGLDSLMAVELRNRFETSFHAQIPLAHLLRGPSIAELATLLLDQLHLAGMPASAPAAGAVPAGEGSESEWEEGDL